MEVVAEVDDALMETFFEKGALSQDDLIAGSPKASNSARTFRSCAPRLWTNIGAHPILAR